MTTHPRIVDISNVHETNDGDDFDHRENEFSFTVSFDTEQVDADDQHQENADPGRRVDCRVPVRRRDSCSHDFKRQHD